MWGALFAAVGKPSAILEGLLDTGALQSSACCLLIVDRLEGAPTAHALALRLIRVRALPSYNALALTKGLCSVCWCHSAGYLHSGFLSELVVPIQLSGVLPH